MQRSCTDLRNAKLFHGNGRSEQRVLLRRWSNRGKELLAFLLVKKTDHD
ncbi:portal protein [Salmonella phage 18-India]|nr:portal protein [Salmonella phage 18-India]